MALQIALGVILGVFGIAAIVAIGWFPTLIVGNLVGEWMSSHGEKRREGKRTVAEKRADAARKWRAKHGLEP